MGHESIAYHLLYNGIDVEFTASEASILLRLSNGESIEHLNKASINDHWRLGYIWQESIQHFLGYDKPTWGLTDKGKSIVELIQKEQSAKPIRMGKPVVCNIRFNEVDIYRDHLRNAIESIANLITPSDSPLDISKYYSITNLLNDVITMRDPEFIEGYMTYVQAALVLTLGMEEIAKITPILNGLLQ